MQTVYICQFVFVLLLKSKVCENKMFFRQPKNANNVENDSKHFNKDLLCISIV